MVIRTCIGCRQRADAMVLVRIVAERHHAVLRAVADHGKTKPGRGAYVHKDPECLEFAIRRKAIGRALRAAGPITDPSADDVLK